MTPLLWLLLAVLCVVVGCVLVLTALVVLFGAWWAVLAAGAALVAVGVWVVPA